MTVYNDSNGNYYSGSVLGGTSIVDLITDWQSMLTGLSVSYTVSNGSICFRPNGDTLTGTIDTVSSINFIYTSVVANQSRLNLQGYNTSSASQTANSFFYLLNSSTNDTEITIRGDDSGVTWLNWKVNVFDSSNVWSVATNKSLSYFVFKNVDNYLFNSVGVVNNAGAYTFPANIFGMYLGRHQGTKVSSFRGCNVNSSIPQEFYKSGSNANYSRPLNNGITAPGCLWLPRRTDNNYAIGSCPNLVSVTRSTITGLSLNIGDYPIDLNNLSTGNNNIDGSTQDKYIYIGNLDSTAGDDAGDGLFMRIYN